MNPFTRTIAGVLIVVALLVLVGMAAVWNGVRKFKGTGS